MAASARSIRDSIISVNISVTVLGGRSLVERTRNLVAHGDAREGK